MEPAARERLERLEKGRVGARAAGVVQLPWLVERREPLHHAPDRRDPDAAGKQDDVLGVLLQREIVARRADLERLADAQLVMDVARAAAARRIALDADRVGGGVALRIDERILPDDAVGQMHVDMGAGLVVGQGLPIEPHEFVEVGVARRIADRAQTHVDQAVVRRRLCGRGRDRAGSHRIHQRFSCGCGAEKSSSGTEAGLSNSGLRYARAADMPTGGKATRICPAAARSTARRQSG